MAAVAPLVSTNFILAHFLFTASIVAQDYAHTVYYCDGDERKICSVHYELKERGQTLSSADILRVFQGSDVFACFNLYTIESARGQGYGRLLLEDVVKSASDYGARELYIQPGPYEKTIILDRKTEDYLKRLESLERFYCSLGFEKASWIEKIAARVLYYVIDLKEDPSYLLKYHFQNSKLDQAPKCF